MANKKTSPGLRFQASAKLQRLLGRDLLSDDYSAIEELVKNAYDSNATEVEIRIIRPSGQYGGEIEIRDNGTGLSLKEFRRLWMWAGYSEKTAAPLPKSGRIQAGEKGIGRFAADKLGESLTVITKPQGDKRALEVTFQWHRFSNQKKMLSDIRIPYKFVDAPLLPQNESGTILRIEGLRSEWNDKTIEELRHRLAQLLNPYESMPQFKITLAAPRPKLSGPIVPSQIKNANFEWRISRSPSGRTLSKRRTRDSNGAWGEWITLEVGNGPKLTAEENFGPINTRFLYFIDRPKKKDVGEVLAGVGVYRDGLRVEPAGSNMADWLGLVAKRAKRAGHMPLVPSRLYGFVAIQRKQNPQLQDATNRRALLGGPAFEGFRKFLGTRLEELELQVEKEVAEPKWQKSRAAKTKKLHEARYQTVSFLSLGLAHELRQPLQSIQTASENITNHLNSASIRIPQVDSATEVIKRSVSRIDRNIVFLKNIGSGTENVEAINLNETITQVIDFFRDQARARNTQFHWAGSPTTINFNISALLITVTNLVWNSVQAIEILNDAKPHVISITVSEEAARLLISVEDDGPGIPEDARNRLFRRPTTSKQGGMGIALIVCRDLLKMFGGDLECTSYANPTQFNLIIPRGQNGANTSS
jgi:signal transduction histidine kinase